MTDLTKITTVFGLLDVETREALRSCGGPWQFYDSCGEWIDVSKPGWFADTVYRQKPDPDPIPDSIDWSHVHDDLICMARDSNGRCFAYSKKPVLHGNGYWWLGGWAIPINGFASYRRGNADWKDSLVWRPGYGPEGAISRRAMEGEGE